MRVYSTFVIAGLCGLVFLVQQFWPQGVFSSMALVSADVWARPWTLLTHTIVHADIFHLGYNMFALLLFGTILEHILGTRRFLWVYLLSGLASGLAGVLFYTASVGASGAIFGVLGCLTILRSRMIVWAMGAPMPMAVAAAVWALVDFIGISSADNIAHFAHLFGLGFGIAAGLYLHDRFGEPLRRTSNKPAHPSDRELDEWEDRYMLRKGA